MAIKIEPNAGNTKRPGFTRNNDGTVKPANFPKGMFDAKNMTEAELMDAIASLSAALPKPATAKLQSRRPTKRAKIAVTLRLTAACVERFKAVHGDEWRAAMQTAVEQD